MAEFPSLPLWTDAFIADTIHLNAEESGALLMLLIVAWRSTDNSLPDDDEFLWRASRVQTLRRWRTKIRPRLEPFFSIDGNNWRQKKLDKVRAAAEERHNKSVQAGKASALKRRNTASANAMPGLGNQSHGQGN